VDPNIISIPLSDARGHRIWIPFLK
jgi:hypothetical protein